MSDSLGAEELVFVCLDSLLVHACRSEPVLLTRLQACDCHTLDQGGMVETGGKFIGEGRER